MTKQRLDNRDKFPSGMEEYLSTYGWHFSKKMCEWAVSKMEKINPATKQKENVEIWSKEKIEEMLKKNNITLHDAEGYDCVYIANMALHDYMKSSITDEIHLILYLKDFFNDPDGYSEKAFTHFYADCIGMGRPIMWEDMM